MTAPDAATRPRQKCPRSVTFFALAVLYLGVVNLARAGLSFESSPFERTLPLTVSLPYLTICGLVWGLVFVGAACGVWRLWPSARKLLLGAVVVYQVHIWINHVLFDTSVYSRQVWSFQAGISVAWIMAVWIFLFLPAIRRLYQPR